MYAARAISVIASNTVGTGIQATIIQRDGSKSKKAESKITDAWLRWAETTDIDHEGRLDIYGIQNMIMRAVAESGEVLIRRRRFAPQAGKLAIKIQILEADFIDTLKEGTLGENLIIQGIEFNPSGERVAYHLFKEHPGDYSYSKLGRDTIRVPAEDILHIFEAQRPGQVRGVPRASTIISKLRDFDDYQDATLLRQKIAACYAAFVTDDHALDVGINAESKESDLLPEKIEPGMIQKLGPGQKVETASPPAADGYSEFSKETLRSVAIGFGITYESLTGDLSNVNFSSGRMGWLEFQRNIEQWRWLMLIPQAMDPVFQWFTEAATLMGLRGTDQYMAEWTPPAREMIDPVSETNATIKQIRSGLKSLPEAIRERGQNPDKVLEEYQKIQKKLDDMGIVLDVDPRKMTSTGMGQNNLNPNENQNGPTDKE
jgi:lambda family phage portal protein